MQYYIAENILVKEISESEYREKNNYAKTKNWLRDVLVKVHKQGNPNCSADISQEAQHIVDSLRGCHRNFGLFYKENYIGYISFAEYDSVSPEIQIEIAEEWRNKGLAYKALSTAIQQLFSERDDIQYFLYCVKFNNYPSIRLVEKLGGKIIPRGNELLDNLIKRYYIYR